MSLNIIPSTEIKDLTKDFLDIFKEEEEKALTDMKYYLNSTNLSEEQKLKEYSNFSSNIFIQKITQTLSSAQQIVIEDVRLKQSDDLNKEQVKLITAQKDLAAQEKTNAIEQKNLITAQKNQVEKEKDFTETKIWLAIMGGKTKADLTVAQTLSEARRNGADITSVERTYNDPITNQSISYEHISLAAASSIDTEKGLLGKQMYLADKQGKTFDYHTRLQVSGQLGQTIQQMVSEGYTNISGLLSSQKNLYISMFPDEDLFTADYVTIPEQP